MADNSVAWYRKYRPKTMEDYLGDSIKSMVNNRFSKPENRPSVIMISGNRGCGKTTFARIVSKYYLCDSPKEDGSPCEECEYCREINDTLIEGESGVEVPGVVEVDATTANGKDAIQEIVEDALIPPIYTSKKLVIFDECHMITNTAQNSLLKIIEDIPPHLVVIFATTDPQKVINTVHSRCQLKIEVRKQSVDDMAGRLLQIAEKENLVTSLEALKIIAKKGDRVPRECINLLESIAKSNGNKVTLDTVKSAIGDVGAGLYIDFYNAANSSLSDILFYNKTLKDKNVEYKDFMVGLCRFTLDAIYVRHGIALDDFPVEFVTQVKELFKLYNSSEFDVILQILEDAIKILDSNDTKSELLLTTTAMRIGKVQLIAEGLVGEVNEAVKENKMSVAKYKELEEQRNQEKIDNTKRFSPTTEAFANVFKNMSQVTSFNPVKVGAMTEQNNSSGSEYFSLDDLDKL